LNLKTTIVAIAVAAFLGFLVWGLVGTGDGALAPGEPVPTASLPTWCVPCRDESPALDRFERENRNRISVLGIDTRDLTDDALAFMEEFNISYAQLRDADGGYADDLETTGVPESFLIDPDGNLVSHFPGPFRNLGEVEEFAAPALADSAGSGGQGGGS